MIYYSNMNFQTHMDKYWNICSFLNDEEVHKVWNIIDDALDRKGWVGFADDAELSIRLFDPNLKQNIDADTVYEASPFGGEDHLFYNS
tara:strand:- start:897 stop:1160 length:264 start_codon:yes stop_codon:yes gene_type:complete